MIRKRREADPADVLVICTGNLCRSPIIATLLAAELPTSVVRSAGTSAPQGRPWHPYALQVLAEGGHEVSGQARRLHKADVSEAKLILTAEGVHRGAVVTLDPDAEHRCFTLLEAARLLRLAPAEKGIGPTELAEHLTTTLHEFPTEYDDNLPDPIMGPLEAFRVCRAQVANALIDLAPALRKPDA